MKAISKAGKPLRFFTLLCYIFMHPEQTKTTLCFRENMKKLFVGDIPTVTVVYREVKREVTLSKGQMFNSKKRISRGFHFFELQKNPYRNQGNRQILSLHTSEDHSVKRS